MSNDCKHCAIEVVMLLFILYSLTHCLIFMLFYLARFILFSFSTATLDMNISFIKCLFCYYFVCGIQLCEGLRRIFNSIQVICVVLFTIQILAKQLYRKVSTLFVIVTYLWCLCQVDVHMAEMYSKNHALWTLLTIIDYMPWSNLQQNVVVLSVVSGLASSEVLWGVGIISSHVFGHLRSL